ncbi:MAG: aldo/keto reductase [Bacteroidales bacterium]|nr:aldo/keto reductase [Bacteroidales bacterium]
MENKLNRRDAIKAMVTAGTALAVTPAILSSCSGSSNKAVKTNINMEPAEGAKVVTREWETLGGEKISLLGLGCMRFPKKGEGRNAVIDQAQVNEMIKYALDHGVNYFDTASGYAGSEEATGIGFAASGYPRESYYIATKLSNHQTAKTLEVGQQIFEDSLKKLQTTYFDFYLLHNLSGLQAMKERYIDNGLLDWLLEQKKAGRIRHLGFSFHGNNAAFKELLDLPYQWDFVQIQMNYVDWESMRGASDTDAKTLYTMLAEKNIPITVMEPIRGGGLATVSESLKNYMAQRRPDLSPAGMALTYVASYPAILCTLSGMSNMAQLKENIATFSAFKPFDESDNEFMMKVADLYNSNTHINCTACEYCMPCPNGVNIPGNFKVFNTTSDELNIPDPTKQDKENKKKKKIFLTRFKKDLADGSRADACTKCNVCLEKCPQHIRIPNELQKILDLVDALS